MNALSELALAGGLAWASGIRLYAAILIVGLLGHFGYLDLPPALEILQHPWVLIAAAVMTVGEFIADKVPAFDSVWDAVHTFIRIPAGAFLAWGAMGDATPAAQLAAAIIGGFITSGTHLAKGGTRAMINTSPEPLSNWTASFSEDGLVLFGLWLALAHPLLFLALLLLFLLLLAWALPKLWRFLVRLVQRLRGKTASARA
ncbi:MAG: DUF4126 domain-containing protein [Dokdonella sp.]|uniref:DUF4126 domain-containing protein n=1 Tax=Dokdonella sp. TaxID=2291710 RepID=UPI0025C0839E|nr:DUF4126 domain-containing protein [Dokdonella sp.]MBZ0221911.1 DUF4126 domain-containing protein [Dokdonella sp.]MCC7256677.1 DUF4126 domain-containing protein [Dokdonella sp.]